MRLLLDTHVLLWWLDGDLSLPLRVREIIDDQRNSTFVSAATAWEIATKFRIGKLAGAALVGSDVAGCLEREGFVELPVTVRHARRAGSLPDVHCAVPDRGLHARLE